MIGRCFHVRHLGYLVLLACVGGYVDQLNNIIFPSVNSIVGIIMKRFFIVLSAFSLSACGTVNNYLAEKTKTVEYYRIFDVKTTASKKDLIKATSDGLGKNVNNAQEATPIPRSNVIPDEPGRFKIVNPFAGSNFAMLAGGAGTLGLQVATCEGAAWTAKAVRSIAGSDQLNVTACLFQYKGGYHLNLYAVFVKREGGPLQVSRDIAGAMVGSPEEWTEKTFLDIVRNINAKVPGKIALLEAQPEISGTPWLDGIDVLAKKP